MFPSLPQSGVKAPLAKVDQVVSRLGHHPGHLGQRRQVVTAGTALAPVSVLAASVLSAPDVPVERSCRRRNHEVNLGSD